MFRFGYPWRSWYGISRNIAGMPWDLWYGIRSVFRWMPVIWFDRDWDDSFFLILVERKLLNMANLFEKYGHHVGSEKSAKRMRMCAALLERVRKDDYYERLVGSVEYKHWTTPTDTPSVFEQLHIEAYRPDGRKITAWENRHFHKKAWCQQKNELEYAFRVIAKHLLGWWD